MKREICAYIPTRTDTLEDCDCEKIAVELSLRLSKGNGLEFIPVSLRMKLIRQLSRNVKHYHET